MKYKLRNDFCTWPAIRELDGIQTRGGIKIQAKKPLKWWERPAYGCMANILEQSLHDKSVAQK